MSHLSQYEAEDLVVYAGQLQQNIQAIEKALDEEKEKLKEVRIELEIRERQEA